MIEEKYKTEFLIMTDAVRQAYQDVFSINGIHARDKDKFDVVTENDYNVEKFLIDVIANNFPNDTILSEETNFETEINGRTWVIDPIDGTYNMSRAIPLFGIQCALYCDGEIVLSIIFLPLYNELFHAIKNKGAYLNGERLFTRKNHLEHSIVSFGDFPHKRPADFCDEHRIMSALSAKIAKVRMFGSACIDFAYLAAGRTDGTIIFTKNKWDIAPGILLATEAGALVRSLSGNYYEESRAVIATGTLELYESIVAAIL